jgi:hypothetical protein
VAGDSSRADLVYSFDRAGRFFLWRFIDWHYKGSLRTSEERLKLRDDEITQLTRSFTREADLPVIRASPSLKTLDVVEVEETHSQAATHISLPWLTSTPLEDRHFLPSERTVNELFDMLEGATSARAKEIVDPYIGKWIKIAQEVADVDWRENHFVVLAVANDRPPRFVWMHFKSEVDMKTVQRGDVLKVVGRIKEISFGSLRLYECEVVRSF